jgi:hypothetical protein
VKLLVHVKFLYDSCEAFGSKGSRNWNKELNAQVETVVLLGASISNQNKDVLSYVAHKFIVTVVL